MTTRRERALAEGHRLSRHMNERLGVWSYVDTNHWGDVQIIVTRSAVKKILKATEAEENA